MRAKTLNDLSGVGDSFSLVELKKMLPALTSLSGSKAEIGTMAPIMTEARVSSSSASNAPVVVDVDAQPSDDVVVNKGGSLLPRLQQVRGCTLLTIRIEKIGLKDITQYLEPFITISVKDSMGFDITKTQDTPISSHREGSYIFFNVDVEIQKPVNTMREGTAIFFEFKHYKPKKSKVSTKCFSFMELDEIRNGNAALEIYDKPTDGKRKRIRLLSIKPLYLHVHMSLHEE
eukprot:Colp12_sorted_trinity150504_noHs@13223